MIQVLVFSDVVNVMAAYWPVVQACGTRCTVHLQTGSSYFSWYAAMILTTSLKTSTWIVTVVLTVVLAKHEIAPWWWFLREPKHAGATVGILIVLIFLWFYICVRQAGRIKSALILLMHGTNMKNICPAPENSSNLSTVLTNNRNTGHLQDFGTYLQLSFCILHFVDIYIIVL
jgi:CBS domain containing-hemolysin-like protein